MAHSVRGFAASGIPSVSAASQQAMVSTRANGLARPMSSAATTGRRRQGLRMSPAAMSLESQNTAASGSEPLIDFCSAET